MGKKGVANIFRKGKEQIRKPGKIMSLKEWFGKGPKEIGLISVRQKDISTMRSGLDQRV